MSNTFRSLSNSESHLLAKYVHKYRGLGLVIFFALNVFCRVDRLEQHPSIHSLPLVQFGIAGGLESIPATIGRKGWIQPGQVAITTCVAYLY